VAGLRSSEVERLVDALEREGCRVKKTTKGYLLFSHHNDHSTTVHKSEEDVRAVSNLKANLRRMGYDWPFDRRRKR